MKQETIDRLLHLAGDKSEPTNQVPAVSSFHDFIGEPTAEKACLLAMDDHRSFAGRLADDQFLMMLSIAAEHSKDRAANLARIAALEDTLRRINEYWPAGTCPSELWNLINNALTDGAKYENEI